MSSLSLEYIAGFFDGEGCVNLTVRGRCRQVALRVMIINTDPLILDLLRFQYGGRLPRARSFRNGWKSFRMIVFVGKQAVRLLEDIAPFVILKRPQVELALEFWRFQQQPRKQRCDVIRLGPARHPGIAPNRITRKPETIQREMEFKQKMHLLNRKGA